MTLTELRTHGRKRDNKVLVERHPRTGVGNWLRSRHVKFDHVLITVALIGITAAVIAGIWSRV